MGTHPLTIHEKLGRAIRELRHERTGLSQEEFARVVGVHRTYMGSVERGEKNISLTNIQRIARALRIQISTLFREAERRPLQGEGRR
jgi:DNA-binding XRE family transcriptional regulator